MHLSLYLQVLDNDDDNTDGLMTPSSWSLVLSWLQTLSFWLCLVSFVLLTTYVYSHISRPSSTQ